MKKKTCIRCGITKPTTSFSAHAGHKDKLDGRCRDCINRARKLRDSLRKSAPPKPEICDCCGKKPKNPFHLDHCHKTSKFRGWVCEYCNKGIGQLGDDVDGVLKALIYLLKHEEKNEKC